jgi:tetratricopeptide (TPR) repeat protein
MTTRFAAQPFRLRQGFGGLAGASAAAVRAACTALLIAATALPAPAQPQDDLSRLEQALSSSPDDLRAGNDYRMAIIKAGKYDRGLEFFEQLVSKHPNASNARLNYGFQYVDKIPAAGSITQVILANNALTEFSKSLEIKPSWIAYYTRGNSYLFWPKIFGRTRLGIADLEEALKIQKAGPKRSYHARVYIALGDGYFKNDEPDKAKAIWTEGLEAFPNEPALKQRRALNPDEMKQLLATVYDPNKRVDTNLQDLWADR